MSEYIEHDKLMKAFAEAETDVMADYGPNYGAEWGFSLNAVKQVIEKIPVADVVSVVHGRWVDAGDGFGVCDLCDTLNDASYNYCPHCGAKMNKEGTE